METGNAQIRDYLNALASAAPTPGGGGAAALTGAVGTALGRMVGSLTVGKKKYLAVEDDMRALNDKAAALIDRFVALSDRDAEVFAPLAAAYRLPKDTEEQRAERGRVMEAALIGALEAPLEIMRACAEAIELTEGYAAKGSALAISDAGVSAAMLRAALHGASLNVYINAQAMADRDRADRASAEADRLIDEYAPRAERIFDAVRARLK